MSFCSHEYIRDNFSRLIIPPHEDKKYNIDDQIQPSSYELRIGREVYLSGENKFIRLDEDFMTSIKPGDFAILLTYEKVNIPPELMGFISIKKTFKDMGLVNISGFHVDPGYSGNLTFSVFNAGPGDIKIRYKDLVFIIFFAELCAATNNYRDSSKSLTNIPSDAMNKLTGKPVSTYDLDTRTRRLELTTRIQWGLLVSLLIGIVVSFLKIGALSNG
jgi:dCTP deaminase